MFKREVRSCLAIVNWYVRDRQMQEVLRLNLLKCAAEDWGQQEWQNTEQMLRRAFGVKQAVDPRTQHVLETYKRVEYSRLHPPSDRKSTEIAKKADQEFAQEWAATVLEFSKDQQVCLQPLYQVSELRQSVFSGEYWVRA